MEPISLALAGLSLGSGIYQLLSNDVPDELQRVYDLYSRRAEHGLDTSVTNRMISSGSSNINRQATGSQAKGAMALASRGTGNSSGADSTVAGIEQGRLGAISDLVSNTYNLDEQAKLQAMAGLAGISNDISQRRDMVESQAWGTIGGSLGSIADEFAPEPESLQSLFDEYFGDQSALGDLPIGMQESWQYLSPEQRRRAGDVWNIPQWLLMGQ